MIDIIYENKGIKILTKNLTDIFPEDRLPLTVQIRNSVSNEVVWRTELNNSMWATFPEKEMNDVFVLDRLGDIVSVYNWNVISDGSFFHKTLWYYCVNLINNGSLPNGLVIGTHDGEFGEWVPIIKNGMSSAVLVEGSDRQFFKLKRNYVNNDNVKLIKDIVTPDGGEVIFYEGGKGYTNSVVERGIRSWEKEEITSSVKKSININDLIISEFNGKLDWIHLDIEGLDAKLLMAINKEFLPNLIIYEDANLVGNEKNEIIDIFSGYNYNHISIDGIAMFIKK